jgi:HAD superfamily hydrolase (TIGR01548 family)
MELLKALGAEPRDSRANFVLARFEDAAFVFDSLMALGIAVRQFANDADLDGCLRISCPGNPKAFLRLQTALRTVLAPQALLFDMDGVLADVTRSYREAILNTAKSYGVQLGMPDVVRAKNEPDSNNDWEVTRRLLDRRGVTLSLDEVKQRFESFYATLWQNETLLVNRKALRRLARRLPLAVVTGRPRADAERFLAQHRLEGIFSEVICLEDAPKKPDPAPVRLALNRLRVRQAWMLGDTPDDMTAARQAGVLPVGVAQSGTGLPSAARVLANADQVEELLP